MATLLPCSLCLLLVFASVRASADIEWTTDSLPDGATVKACIGETAEFPWAISLQPDDTVVKVEWFTIKDGVEQVLAISSGGHFFKSSAAGLKLVFLPNAGLRVSNHTWRDFGQYRVTVHVARNGALLSSSRAAVLSPPDAPVLATERLVAKLLPHPKPDVATGELQLQLSCGRFANVGSRPVPIVWRTPSGKIVPSTTMSRGSFLLTLPNPVQAGTYVCLLEDPSVADKCVQNLLTLKRGAHVTVYQVPARLSLLDTQVDVLQQKTREADSELKDSQTALASEVSDLRSELENHKQKTEEVDSELKDSQTAISSDVSDLRSELENHKQKTEEVDSDLKDSQKAISSDVSDLRSELENHKQKTREADSELKDSQTALASDVSDLRSELEKQNVIDSSLQQQVTDLSAENKELKEKLKQQKDEFSSLKSQMDSQKAEVGSQKERLDSLSDSVTEDLRSQVTKLARQYDVLSSDVSKRSKAVAFTASLRGGGRIDIGDNTPIKFNNVVTNFGNGYSSHTGFFTAPVAGTYGFYLTVKGANIPEVVHVGIYKSGRILTRTEARGTAKDIYDKGSCFAITHLNVGDRVHARRMVLWYFHRQMVHNSLLRLPDYC